MGQNQEKSGSNDNQGCVPYKGKRESAFRAINTTAQPVEANQSVKVYFDEEEFDLGREYEPGPSIFEPRKDGVYLITATVGFEPENFNQNYRARVEIQVNGQPFEAADNDFWGAGVQFINAVGVTAILKLEADDCVEVFLQSSVSGRVPPSVPGSGVNAFSAARLIDLH
jgi:hypothetical protein